MGAEFQLPRPIARNRGIPRTEVDTVGDRKILRDHRPVKSDKARGIGEVGQKGRDIAVADKYLGIRPDLVQVETLEQIVRAITTARANDGTHLVAHKHLFEFLQAAIDRARKVEFAIKNRIEVKRLVS